MRQILLAALFVVATPIAAFAQYAEPRDETVLRPGDAVRITVWRQPELSGEFAIAEDGTILHPLYRQLAVAGHTRGEVEAKIGEFLTGFETSPRFVVEPLLRVSVGGEVRQPSLYMLAPETTIAQAVALAGGATDRSRLDRVRLFRGGEEYRVDLTHPEAGLAQEPIRSGDQIFVDRKVSIFREYIAPAGSITAALAAIAGLILNH